ncbi:MAG: UTP--glucose-1-phosphate uridylyltransferase [Planctomycetota bacterium]|nr:UTP--glucose-1-phosphate uridylyltransferase [Planctomycetota bacterium]
MIQVEDPTDQAMVAKIHEAGQEHLFDDWDQLDSATRHSLLEDLHRIDLGFIQQLIRDHLDASASEAPIAAPTPPDWIPLSDPRHSAARQRGLEALQRGEVAVMMVAGGVGTRLGHPGPKGSFPILPISGGTLFQIFAESLLRLQKKVGRPIHWIIMTSPTNHSETVQYFKQHDYHGLTPSEVTIVPQEQLPVLDARRQKILRSGPGQVMFSPDGHGGSIRLLQKKSAELRQRGIQHIYTHQVDNPLARMADPELVGLHIEQDSRFTSKAVAKTDPDEKVGVFCNVGDHLRVIEYSELGKEDRHLTDADGSLSFRAGNIATHVIELDFIAPESTTGPLQLPFHVARKAVRHWHGGDWHESTSPNSVRFETFIFDVLPMANRGLIVEADREQEFAPVKNGEGSDSPATSRAALQRIWASWLMQCGIPLELDASLHPLRPIEISPLVASDAAELKQALEKIEIPTEGPILLR